MLMKGILKLLPAALKNFTLYRQSGFIIDEH